MGTCGEYIHEILPTFLHEKPAVQARVILRATHNANTVNKRNIANSIDECLCRKKIQSCGALHVSFANCYGQEQVLPGTHD